MGLFDRFRRQKDEPEDKPENSAEGEPAADSPPEEPPQQPAEPPQKKKGLFARLKSGLKKTKSFLSTDIRDLFKSEGRLVDEAFLEEVRAILIRTDMGVKPANEIIERIQSDFRGRKVQKEDILENIRETFREQLQQPDSPIEFADSGPTVVLVVGVNGSGKTTSIAKLANMFHSQGKKVVLGAGDTFRAAAVEQLTIWAERIGCDIVKGESGGDPASVAHRTVSAAIETNADICIIDTAGRLQTQGNLMKQLEKIRRVASRPLDRDEPHEVLLVLDATAGQNGISQAQGFSVAAGCTGIVLAKLDGTAKGGVVIPIRQKFGIPVKFVGVGETLDDLILFNVDNFVAALFADDTA